MYQHYNDYFLNKENNISLFNKKYSKYNTSSTFINSTYNCIPKTSSLKKQINIPFALNISPLSNFSEKQIPLIDYSESYDNPRCKNPNCQAFLNPFVEFINNGEQWKCNICKNINKVEEYYYSDIDDNGIRLDQETKPELNLGTYEFISYKESLLKEGLNVVSYNYFFLIDISSNAVNSGFTQCVLESIKDCINNNCFYDYENSEIKISIITYDEQIHFYPTNIKNENDTNNINMLSINESSNNLFLPTNKNHLLLNLKKYKNKFIQIIESIQNLISSDNYYSIKESNRFFDVIKICDLIGAKEGGKILIFNGSSISNIYLMNGKINKDITDKKYKYITTEEGKIGKFGISISLNGLSPTIFLSSKTYTNIITLNKLIINSNGNCFFYRNFSPDIHYKNIFNQIRKTLQNQTVFESGLKLRFSHNFTVKDYLTPTLLYSKNIIYFPNLTPDQNFSFVLEMNYNKEEDTIGEYNINDDFSYLQGTLFYKRGDGKKIIRVFNLCFPVVDKFEDIYDYINPEILGAFYSQKLIMDIIRNKSLVNSVNKIEKEFFLVNKSYFNNLNMIKKELNENMKLFSLYVLGLFKNCLFNKNDKGINNDDDLTNFYFTKLQRIKIEEILCFIYPRIYALDEILNSINEEQPFPSIINDNKESIETNGNIFLIDNGFNLYLYLKNNLNENIVYDLFGVDDINKIELDKIIEENIFDYTENKSEIKNKISELINSIRDSKSLFQNLKIIIEGINDQKGKIINEILIEDNYIREFPFSFENFLNKIIFDK